MTQEGGPIEVPAERRRPGADGARDDGLLYGWWRLMEAIWRSETPFIASVNGPAVGGGCQLALACDLILAAEEATFWEIFVQRGLPLEGGGAWLLTRSISLPRAKELALYGDPLPAAEAERWGLINRCVPAAELEATTRDWARRLGATRRTGHIKGQLNGAWEQTMPQTFVSEVTLLGLAAAGMALPHD
jgi:2-(1,2-epoxy-1,2-dihydrophenyl)acetyl-CoA isomerase